MTTHVYHPDVHEFGLQVGCPRCEELALNPEQLDSAVRDRLTHGRVVTTLDRIAQRVLLDKLGEDA